MELERENRRFFAVEEKGGFAGSQIVLSKHLYIVKTLGKLHSK